MNPSTKSGTPAPIHRLRPGGGDRAEQGVCQPARGNGEIYAPRLVVRDLVWSEETLLKTI